MRWMNRPFSGSTLNPHSHSIAAVKAGWAVVVVALASATACSPARVSESVMILQDIQAASGPSDLKDKTLRPTRSSIRYIVAGRTHEADLYLPGTLPGEAPIARADMILIPGLSPKGRHDPRVIAFAQTLARAEFQVFVPDLPNMRRFQVTVDDAVIIADAACWLQRAETTRPLGITAVSFAVGPAVAALYQPEAERRVDFFLAVGGYHDITALITYVTTGYYRRAPNEPWQHRPPKRFAKWVFLLTNAVRLDDLDDKLTLIEMAERRLDDPDADVEDLVARLGPEGRSVYDLIENNDPDRVPALLAAGPRTVRREAAALDPSRRDLTAVTTRFLLVHDRDDRTVPASQSSFFADATRPGQTEVFFVDGLDHAEPKEPTLAGSLTFVDAVYSLLAERDAQVDAARPPCTAASPMPDVLQLSWTEAPPSS
jgi:pimeloyl-ACP methyl ester carboxylesterase